MRICFVTSELAPLAKVGGLADVSGALPRELLALGHDVRPYLPLYRRVREAGVDLVADPALRDVPIQLGSRTFRYSIHTTRLPGSELDVRLVDCPALYDRPGIYTQDADEHLRFLLLTRVAIECCQRTQWSPDVLHCNDWQTALAPLYLRTVYRWDRLFEGTRSVLTIHNLGYQGTFSAGAVGDLGLGEAARLLHQEDLAAGRISFLKTGLAYADVLTTVTGTFMPGATRREGGHPFRKHFEDLAVGDSLVTESRTVTVEDIERFADLTGDRFYAHMDEEAARQSPIFQGRVAHGYFVISAAAGLFVWPDPGPVLANYGLENLRFLEPTYPGDELTVTLTVKQITAREDKDYGEVRWDADVTKQTGDSVARYDVLTLVAKRS